ncbi:MAG: ATP-binding protein [Caldilineaceae bacterium]
MSTLHYAVPWWAIRRLRQIVLNLAGNAVKFTNEGEVVIRADLEAEQADDVTVRFSIVDSGIGIDMDKRETLFQPFNQADSSTTRRYGGTGLGLAVSKKLVELMGGEIDVADNPVGGTIFWFTAPLTKSIEAREAERPCPQAPTARVLVGGGNLAVIDSVASHLRFWGCRYDVAHDDGNVLSLMQQAAVDGDPYVAACIDWDMIEPIEERFFADVEAAGFAPERLLMLATLPAQGQCAARCRQSGGRSLTKPVKSGTLRTVLQELVSPGIPAAHTPRPTRPFALNGTKPTPSGELVLHNQNRGYRVLLVEDNAVNRLVGIRMLANLGYRADAVESA